MNNFYQFANKTSYLSYMDHNSGSLLSIHINQLIMFYIYAINYYY